MVGVPLSAVTIGSRFSLDLPYENVRLVGFYYQPGISPFPEDQFKIIIPEKLILSIYLKAPIIETMLKIVKQIHNILVKSNKTVAVAESCTGGLLSYLLTQLPGSSRYFLLGTVTYSNKSKENILRLPQQIIAKNGTVSKPVAVFMAEAARKISRSDFGIGITGIAGPQGGTPTKPIGTVFIALDSRDKKICKKFVFRGSRTAIRKQAALKSLELLYEAIYCYRITRQY